LNSGGLKLRNFFPRGKAMENIKTLRVHWFEIPVLDMNRAITFYETVFQTKMSPFTLGSIERAWFTTDVNSGDVNGMLIKNENHYKPGHQGTLIYFSTENIMDELERVEKAGGRILLQKSRVSPKFGFMAIFEDCEGNRIALHSKV
jgi:uncharacterized protein